MGNTQLAHLYTELTMARTEAQHLRSEQVGEGQENATQGNDNAGFDSQKQCQQIADLVSDIRHLQLDLEYHQQKLDQMIEEKATMMKDLKRSQMELKDVRNQLSERDQLIKHREVDLAHLKQELKSPGRQIAGSTSLSADDGMLQALRAEAAAKDSALIVSHYELHKEKLMRDRLEQKNLKLMERMQKLMMVVETMRKDNVTLERSMVAKDRQHDEKDMQLRQVSQKARQLQKLVKSSKQPKSGNTLFEMETPAAQGIPTLQRSIDSARGGRSGASTPRSRGAPSPYGTR